MSLRRWLAFSSIYANKGRILSAFLVTASICVLILDHELEGNPTLKSHSDVSYERLKRSLKLNVDPVADTEVIYDSPARVSRRILNESDSYTEENGKKKPKPLKSLNMDYVEAKKRFYAPKPDCIERNGTGNGSAPGGAPPAAADPAAAAPPPPPGRRKRDDPPAAAAAPAAASPPAAGAPPAKPFCDELKNGTANGTAPAAADPAAAAPPPPPGRRRRDFLA